MPSRVTAFERFMLLKDEAASALAFDVLRPNTVIRRCGASVQFQEIP
jgi:hypothetical protein